MEFFVHGIPTPQGSKQAFVRGGRAVIVDAGSTNSRSRHAEWRSAVTYAAQQARGEEPTLTGAVSVTINFRFPPVKSDPYRNLHTTTPDLDKLIRAVLDSLTNAGVMADDSLVCDVSAMKRYVTGEENPGALIKIIDWSFEEKSLREMDKIKAAQARKAAKKQF